MVEQIDVTVKAVFLTPDLCHALFVSPGYLGVESVLEHAMDAFTMTSTPMKGATVDRKNIARKVKQPKVSASAAQSHEPAAEIQDAEPGMFVHG